MRETSKYYPFRYVQERSFAKRVATYWQNNTRPNEIPTIADAEEVQRIVSVSYNDAILQLPFKQRPENADLLLNEINAAMTYGIFVSHGRNIFDFSKDLISMFKQTDVGDVPVSTIMMPYDSIYLNFGRQDELRLISGHIVEGAYIYMQRAEIPVLQIDLTTYPAEDAPLRTDDFIVSPIGRYHLALELEGETPIGEALKEALDTEVALMQKKTSLDESVSDLQKEGLKHDMEVVSIAEEGGLRRSNALKEGYPIFREAINLVMNGLFYLSAYPDDNKEGWPDDAPKTLTDKADNGKTHKEKKRALSKLLPLGYTKVKFCRLDKAFNNATSLGDKNKQHWRRGHWRNQVHGPKRSLRKLKWIMPMLINKDDLDTPDPVGHIYTVNSDTL